MIIGFYKELGSWLKSSTMRLFILSLGLFIAAAVLGHLYFVSHPETAQKAFSQLAEILAQKINLEARGWELFTQILLNNLRAGVLFLLFGLIPFLFLPVIGIAANGLQMGLVSSVSMIQGKAVGRIFLFGILPHGIIEIPAILMAGSLGLYLSIQVLKKIFRPRQINLFRPQQDSPPFRQILKRTVLAWAAVVFPLLIAAAMIEAFLTPRLIEAFLK
jgi:stage II sporulation protein M